MSKVELREEVFKKLKSVDEHLLKEVLALINFEIEQGEYELSDNQKSAVDEARQQINEGNSFTNDEVNKEIDEWLNK
ncbi:hypothetical protein N9L92_03715 [Saprospiraceae bacterium]|nr:hypothetical protein [Saprospiraceae bacterium]